MTNDHNLAARLAFVGLDDDVKAALKNVRPLIMKVLPGILDGFYSAVAKFPEVSRLFSNQQHMTAAKEAQIRHWGVVADGDFSEGYVQSVTRIGEAHARLGLEPRWYIGGYSFILSGLLTSIETQISAGLVGKTGKVKKADMLAAVAKASLLDMDFAISIYLEAGWRERAKQEVEARDAAAKREAEAKEAAARAAAELRKADMHKLADEFHAAVGTIISNVTSAASELESAAGTLTNTATETQQLAAAVASASEEASANVQSVASAAEEMATSIGEIGQQMSNSNTVTGEAVKQAEVTNDQIGQLAQSANRIGDVVKLINAIAAQTNLLALNATIEAARAGEAGKGFAVVAQEVKALAAQTAKATDEIGGYIASMQTATQDAVTAIKSIGGTIAKISDYSSHIAAAVEEQSATTQEITRNIHQAAEGAATVTTNASKVNSGAVETGSASTQVLTSARTLSKESEHLRAEVERFLGTVRAA